MHIRPTWLKDIMSVVFAGYYLINANEADEKVRTRSRQLSSDGTADRQGRALHSCANTGLSRRSRCCG